MKRFTRGIYSRNTLFRLSVRGSFSKAVALIFQNDKCHLARWQREEVNRHRGCRCGTLTLGEDGDGAPAAGQAYTVCAVRFCLFHSICDPHPSLCNSHDSKAKCVGLAYYKLAWHQIITLRIKIRKKEKPLESEELYLEWVNIVRIPEFTIISSSFFFPSSL